MLNFPTRYHHHSITVEDSIAWILIIRPINQAMTSRELSTDEFKYLQNGIQFTSTMISTSRTLE